MSNQNNDPGNGHGWIGVLHNLHNLFESWNQFKHAWEAFKNGEYFRQTVHLFLGGLMCYVSAVVLFLLTITAPLAPLVGGFGFLVIVVSVVEFIGLCIIRTVQFFLN
jgi:hypothetical protein